MKNKQKHYKTIDAQTFEEQVVKGEKMPAVVVFSSRKYAVAQIIDNFIAALSEEFHPNVQFFRLEVEEQLQVAEQLGVEKIPTIYFFKEHKVLDYIEGTVPKSHIRQYIQKTLGHTA